MPLFRAAPLRKTRETQLVGLEKAGVLIVLVTLEFAKDPKSVIKIKLPIEAVPKIIWGLVEAMRLILALRQPPFA